jgi:hypothetical protein
MQLTLVIVAVLLATGYLARGVWLTWAGANCGSGGGCGGGCGPKTAAPQAPLIPVDDLTARLRARN